MRVDEKYGGQGLGFLESAIVAIEFGTRDSTLASALFSSEFGSEIVSLFGNEEQKRKYLPLLTRGIGVSAATFTEPDHGSDITVVLTTAKKDGNDYVINGTKTLITNATYADYIIILCQTDPEAKPTYRGMSMLLVDKGTKGVEATKLEGKLGARGAPAAEVSFDNVRVPREALLGEEGKGYHQAMQFFTLTRALIGARAVGVANGAFDRALDYAKKRQQFGRPISEFQAIQHKLADMATMLESARMLAYRAAWYLDQEKTERGEATRLSSMAKYWCSKMALEVTDEAIHVFGGYGYLSEYEVERYYRDARYFDIVEGTREIQKTLIAGAILG